MNKKTCKTCKYCESLVIYYCIRYPPNLPTDKREDRFPPIRLDMRCGEYKPREKPIKVTPKYGG